MQKPASEGSRKAPRAHVIASLAVSAASFLLTQSTCWAAEPQPKNQASAADTVILPPQSDDNVHDKAADAALLQTLRSVGLDRLDHVGIINATVDADGCMEAPLAAQMSPPYPDRHSDALEAMTRALRRRGITATMISGRDVQAVDLAEQDRIRAMKDSFHLRFGEGPGRWLATKAEMIACTKVDDDEDKQNRTSHAKLAAMLAALHQDTVLAIGESRSESKGSDWNMVEGELNSDGKSLYDGKSQAEVSATLVLSNGMTPWSGKAYAYGTLRPPLDQQAAAKLNAYLTQELGKLQAFRIAHPDAKDPPDDLMDKAFNAIASGDLDSAPMGTTLGPSAYATLQAAADRLVEQLRPILPAK